MAACSAGTAWAPGLALLGDLAAQAVSGAGFAGFTAALGV